MGFKIGERQIGDGAPCLIVAEVGNAHEGSLGMAHSYIDAVAEAGVDAVKFQCHRGDPVSEWRVKPEWVQEETRQEYWKRVDFTDEQWWGLMMHAAARGLMFLCSPFSVEAVKLLDPLVEAWKVPSGRITDRPLLRTIAATRKPVLLSKGMCTLEELAEALVDVRFRENDTAVLHARSLYPCPPEALDLGYFDREDYLSGLSDHSGTIYAGLAAVALGASIVEVHVCFSKEQYGFDTEASLDMGQLRQLVEGVRFIEKALQPVDKDEFVKELEPMRQKFMREAANG